MASGVLELWYNGICASVCICTCALIAVITQTCTKDGTGCERDDLHPHPLTLSIHFSPSHSPPYPPTPTPPTPTPLLTLPPYLYSPSSHSLFSILAAILHLGNIQFFKVSTEVASTAQCELVTGYSSLSNSLLHVLVVAPVCTGDPWLYIHPLSVLTTLVYESPSVMTPPPWHYNVRMFPSRRRRLRTEETTATLRHLRTSLLCPSC